MVYQRLSEIDAEQSAALRENLQHPFASALLHEKNSASPRAGASRDRIRRPAQESPASRPSASTCALSTSTAFSSTARRR
jgi:hypothetical protein